VITQQDHQAHADAGSDVDEPERFCIAAGAGA
jgi:hypothetical protein